jgi:uncharacterized protein (TIGR03545 family)
MENMDKPNKVLKPKSIIRWEALTVFTLVLSLAVIYVVFLLEFHLKWIAENTAFESIGTEVNIDSIDIDFFEPSVLINRIQVTNPDKPEENSIEIGKIKVNFSYAPLLKESFVSDETSVLGIKFHTKRARKGRVLPKEQRVLILKDPSRAKVHDALRGKFKASAFSDLADLFRKDKREEIEKQYKEKLASLKVSEEIESQSKSIEAKAKAIEDKISSPEIKALLADVKSFKFESGSTKESLDSASKALALVEKLKSKKKEIKNEVNSLQSEIKSLTDQVKAAPAKFLKDSNLLKASLDPSQLSPSQISEEILSEYFSVQLSQIDRVASSLKKQALGDKAKYVDPANLPQSSGDSAPSKSQMSLEKEKERAYKKYGKNVIFYKPGLLPKYWFKKINISSKASAGQDFGDVTGLITDFSASPELLKNPMVIKIKGSVPKQGIGSFTIDSTIDHRKINQETEKVSIEVTDYLVKGLELFGGSDEWIKIVKSNASTVLDVFLQGDEIDLVLKQTLKTPSYEVFAKDKNVEALMLRLKDYNSDLNLSLKASGDIKKPKLRISSNIGDVILKIVKAELKSQAGALVLKGIDKLSESASKKLGPYIKNLDMASLKAGNLDKVFDQEIEKGIDKLKNKDQVKDLKKDLLKKLFKKL